MGSLSETYKNVRPGIVAFFPTDHDRLRKGSLPFEFIFGTGFVVGESLIATNAHVVDLFKQFKREPDGGFQVSALIIARINYGMVSVVAQVRRSVKAGSIDLRPNVHGKKWTYGPICPDLGLVSVDYKGLSKLALPLKTDFIDEGTSVATAGFPMGPVLLHLEGQLDHVSPTLQSGIISASLPFPGSPAHGYLANIMVQGGASGSPVFLPETGEVIGVIHSSRHDVVELKLSLPEPISVPVPTNFSHVVPSIYLENLISETAGNLLATVPADVLSLDELIENLPVQPPTEKLTVGKFEPLPKQ